MRYRIWAGMILLMIGGTLASGQGKKTIRERKIASVTVQEYFLEEGMDEPVVESVETYDENGELIEIREYNKKGEIKKWEKYRYDEAGNLVEEVVLDEKGRITSTEKTIFEDGLRVERQFYDDKGRLYKKKAYLYEYR